MRKNASLIYIVLISSFSWATSGPSNGGGGDVIILPDDRVVIADPFLKNDGPQPGDMPPLRSLNPRILKLAELYLQVANKTLHSLAPYGGVNSEIALEMKSLTIRENNFRFYGVNDVTELNNYCASGGKKSYKLPDGSIISQVACTSGPETFLIEPLFKKLSLRDQVLLLFHERLTTLRDVNGGRNYSAIARFTTGLDIYLRLYQEQSKDHQRNLSPNEITVLTEFYLATEEIQYRNSNPSEDSFEWVAHSRGGGRVHNSARVDSTAFVSVTSVVPKESQIGANARVIRIEGGIEKINIGKASTLANNQVGTGGCNPIIKFVQIGENSLVENVTYCNVGSLLVGSDSTISKVWVGKKFRSNSELKPTYEFGNRTKIIASTIESFTDITLLSGQTLENGKVVFDLPNKYAPAGVKVLPININWTGSSFLIKFSGRSQPDWLTSKYLTSQINELSDHNKGWTVSAKVNEVESNFFNDNTVFKAEISYGLRLQAKWNTDPNLYLITGGKIEKAGPEFYADVCIIPRTSQSYPVREEVLKAVELRLNASNLKYDIGWMPGCETALKIYYTRGGL